MPYSDIGVKPSLDNLKTAPLCLSVKYDLKFSVTKEAGSLDIP